MSLITIVFGEKILQASLTDIKKKIKELKTDRKERKSYLLKEFARINNILLTKKDFQDIED